MLDLSPSGIADRAERFGFEPRQLRTPLTSYALAGWVHVGRVNTRERMAHWLDLADSIDGSGVSRDPRNEQLAAVLAVIRGEGPQMMLSLDQAA